MLCPFTLSLYVYCVKCITVCSPQPCVLNSPLSLFVYRELHSQQINRTESLEAKLQGAEQELKSTSTLLHERANQITSLQCAVEHKQASLTALEEVLKCERDRQTKIEFQYNVASDKVSTLQSEVTGLRQKADFADRRSAEREASSQQMQARFDSLQSSLRAEYEKVR